MSVKRRGGDKDANWFYRFTYKGHDYCEGGFPNKQQAMDAERVAMNTAIARVLHPEDYGGALTFRQAAEWWLKEYASTKREKHNDIARLGLAMLYFDQKLMSEIAPGDIDAFLGQLEALRNAAHDKTKRHYKIGTHTRNHYRATLHALYERLKFKRMYRGENPVSFVEKIEVPTVRTRFIYPAEEKILTPAVAAEPDLFAYYRTGIETGMRIGEMRTTRVKHLDHTLRSIFVPDPKNRRSRYVPLNDPLLAFLAPYAAGKDPEAFLLPHWSWQYLDNHLKAICQRLGLKGITIHVWRHTFAYNALSQGEDIYKVSKIMGHSSVAVTEKHYGHLAAKDLRDSIMRTRPFLSCNQIATADQILDQKEALI